MTSTQTSTSSKFNTDSEKRNVVRYGYDDAYRSTSAGRKVDDMRNRFINKFRIVYPMKLNKIYLKLWIWKNGQNKLHIPLFC